MARQQEAAVDEQVRMTRMTVTNKTGSLRELFAGYREGGLYVPGVAALAAVVTAAGLLSVLPASSVTSWALTADASPIVEAGGLAQPVIGFFQFGVVRIYVPLVSVLLVVGGELAAIRLGRLGMLTAVAAGGTAGVQPVVVSGCGCGYGTAGTAMSLLEQAIGIGLL